MDPLSKNEYRMKKLAWARRQALALETIADSLQALTVKAQSRLSKELHIVVELDGEVLAKTLIEK